MLRSIKLLLIAASLITPSALALAPQYQVCMQSVSRLLLTSDVKLKDHYDSRTIRAEGSSSLVLTWSKIKLGVNSHYLREQYLKILQELDRLFLTGACPLETELVLVNYPGHSYAISLSQLKAIRKFKPGSRFWQDQAIIRSNVASIQ